MPSGEEIWEQMLDIVGYSPDQKRDIMAVIPTARLLVGATEKVLVSSNIPPLYTAEIMGLRA